MLFKFSLIFVTIGSTRYPYLCPWDLPKGWAKKKGYFIASGGWIAYLLILQHLKIYNFNDFNFLLIALDMSVQNQNKTLSVVQPSVSWGTLGAVWGSSRVFFVLPSPNNLTLISFSNTSRSCSRGRRRCFFRGSLLKFETSCLW